MIDYNEPKYESRLVAEAAGLPIDTFRSYFRRGHFRILGHAKEASAHGLPHKFSLRDAMGFAVAGALISAGADPKDAFNAAMIGFAHSSSGARTPSGVFDIREHGFTVMVFFPASGAERIIAMQDAIGFADAFIDPHTGRRSPSIVLLLNDIERAVFSALNVDDRDPA